ncbi:Hypothetical protein LUCI_4548 [Lucifera butyrica]|uniref:Uncharacterized protein n=1 Tax=Lucifera butyrica TaxID=1351585 RepID=A0A498RJQ3_9FIRM|nr:hypothetical protein [Lucifera butyrica]VBB09258.1 Hypothetical protein LUCI_4548 [Lucifera butyrica]
MADNSKRTGVEESGSGLTLIRTIEGVLAITADRRLGFLCLLIPVLTILALPLKAQALPATVDAVQVTIQAGESPLPAKVAKRMADSVRTVGEQLLLGKSVAEVAASQASYEKLIKEVFDRVLVGYSVQSVTIDPAGATQIDVVVAPWGEVVRDVTLKVNLDGISPELSGLIAQDMGNIKEQVDDVFVGLSVDAADWAGSVSKNMIREMLAAQLPEFRVSFDVTAGPHTVVKLSLAPTGPLIQNVRVSLRSRTIPNLLLFGLRPVTEDAVKSLNGLPVAFVERHRDYFTAKLQAALSQQSAVRQYGLALSTDIYPGAETVVAVNADTDKYKVTLEGYLDMGHQTDNTAARLHIGRYLGKRDELFMETTFYPNSVTWQFRPGWSHSLSSNMAAGFKYDLSDRQAILWGSQYLGHNLTLRLERTPATGYDEFGIRYKLHDFLSAEYVFTKDEKWLRLIGNL